jgi:ribosomal protein L16 Arg81 hydroxylase
MYMAQQNISITHPELEQFIEFNQLLPYGIVKQSNLWVGPGGTKAPLHMDPDDNFFLQLKGSKTFYLFSPADTQYIYANSSMSQKPEFSQIQASDIDHLKFPKAKQAKLRIVTIKEGEILFLPAYWWHEVVNGLENSISINLWCRPKFFGHYRGMRQLLPKKIKKWTLRKTST